MSESTESATDVVARIDLPEMSSNPDVGSCSRRVLLVGAGSALLATACQPPGASAPASGPASTSPATHPVVTTPATTPTSSPTTTLTTTLTTTPPSSPTTTPTTTPTIPGGPATGLGALPVELIIDKLTYGVRPGLKQQILTRGVEAWVEDQLDPHGRGVPDAEARLVGYSTLTNTHRQNYDVMKTNGGAERLLQELDHATLQRAVYSERQLYEVMVDFWVNHFNVWRQKDWTGFLVSRSHGTVVRPHALGKFSDLLWASAHDTSMLYYLDQVASVVVNGERRVNENYAREILELHTLGVLDSEQAYTEADVRGVASLLSGWSINWDDSATRYDFKFNPWGHDLSAISVLDGAFSRPKRNYGQGLADGEALLGVLARHPSTARHLATKLCRRFVGDAPPLGLVQSAAQVYLDHDTAIAPVLRHIFLSAEFAASGDSKVRRPFELLVAQLRATAASMPTLATSKSVKHLAAALDALGQPIFERVSPDGYPDVGRYWTTSDSLLKRWHLGGVVATNTLTSQTKADDRVRCDLAALIAPYTAGTVAELVTSAARDLANFAIAADDVEALCVETGVAANSPATTVTSDPIRLGFLVGLLFAHPQFQRR